MIPWTVWHKYFSQYLSTGDEVLNHTLEIQFDTDRFVNDYLARNTKVVIPYINHEAMTIYGVDLTALPTEPIDFRTAFVKWLIKINEPRLRVGKDLLITYDIVRRCPLWKVVPMPFRPISLTPEAVSEAVGKPAVLGSAAPRGTIKNRAPIGSIGSKTGIVK